MKKQLIKEIEKITPLIFGVIALMASVIIFSFKINYTNSIEWMIGILGSMSGALLVYGGARIQKALHAPKIFISYSHDDYDMVSKICKALENYTVEVLLDKQELSVGDNIKQRISEMVDDSDYFIYVNSKNSNESSWATKELEKAKEQRKKILPVQLDDSKMPEIVSGLVFADFVQSFDKGIEQLGRALRHNKKIQPTQKTRG